MPSSWEDASRCPKCDKPGEEGVSRIAPNLPKGTKVIEVWCRNPLCRWLDTCWLVQRNPDGTVPDPVDHSRSPKLYQGFEGHDEMAANIRANIDAARIAETKPGAEVRNPHSG